MMQNDDLEPIVTREPESSAADRVSIEISMGLGRNKVDLPQGTLLTKDLH